MTYAEACRKAAKEWRKLAKRMAERKTYQPAGPFGFMGLCGEVGLLPFSEVRSVMGRQLWLQMEAMGETWYADEGDFEARVLPCLLLALEAREMALATPDAFDMGVCMQWYFPEENVYV